MAKTIRRGKLSRATSSRPSVNRSGLWISRYAPGLTILLLIAPVVFGFLGTLLPAIGYLPGLGGSELTTSHFRALAEMPGLGRSVGLSLLIGLITALVSLVLTATFVGGYLGSKLFASMRQMIAPLLAVPHAAAAFGLAFLIAPSGMILRMLSPWLTGYDRPPDLLIVNDATGWTMMAGLVAKEIPFLFLVMLAALPQINHHQAIRLGRSIGYGQLASFVFLVWPTLYKQIRLAVFAVLAYASSVVDVAIILGPQLPATLPVRLIGWMNDPELSMRYLASAGAIVQLATTLAVIGIWLLLERLGGAIVAGLRNRGMRLACDRIVRSVSLAGMAGSAAVILFSIVVMAIWSVAGLWQFPDALPETLSLRSWSRALPQFSGPLITTLIVATLSSAVAVLLVILCLERERETGRGRDQRALLLLYLPLIVPQISFLFGMQYLAIVSGMDGSLFGLTLAHLVFVVPYVFLALSDPWRNFDKRYDSLAAGLGLNRRRALMKIRIPMLLRAILTAFAVGFAVSVGQYLPTVLIGGGRLTTITSEAVALAAGGNHRSIGVYAFLQTILPCIGFLIATAVPGLLFTNRRRLRV